MVLGLIDTGADECTFPADYAELFGHNLTKGRKNRIMGVGGEVEAYLHKMVIEIPDVGNVETVVDFIPGLKTPLLGVKSFLQYFELKIDYPKQVFSLIRK